MGQLTRAPTDSCQGPRGPVGLKVETEARRFLLLQAPMISVRDRVEAGLLDGLLQRRVDVLFGLEEVFVQ
eukprot:2134395-Heterocapsa_arctica.AAC.1